MGSSASRAGGESFMGMSWNLAESGIGAFMARASGRLKLRVK